MVIHNSKFIISSSFPLDVEVVQCACEVRPHLGVENVLELVEPMTSRGVHEYEVSALEPLEKGLEIGEMSVAVTDGPVPIGGSEE